ncbi:MAG: hypothetical protein ACHQM6_08205, partial [Candidatus Kapaibacterium sp.]
VHAQYWGIWQKTHNITLGVSTDEKWVFFIQKNEAGVNNIYKVELKTNAVTPITNFTERPVLNGIVLFGKPAIVFARAASTNGDIHLYRINVLTNDPPVDFTPKDNSTGKKILGMADNGRYVYYLSDRAGSHTDTYRYDTQQYVTELAFANDKDFETLGWSHDQTQLLLRDPKTDSYYRYSIETTDKQPADATDAMLSLYKANEKVNLSVNQKYVHIPTQEEKILDASKTPLLLPDGAFDLIVSPKELSVLFANTEGGVMKLYLYDIAKKTSKELTAIK